MARQLADCEEEAAVKMTEDEMKHWELSEIWSMIQMLDQALPASSRPKPIDVIISMADQRKAVAGMIAKDPLECRLASVSCQNLEGLYLNNVVGFRNGPSQFTESEFRGQG